MDLIKRLLGIETDKEWFAGAPFGFDSPVVVACGNGKRHRLDTAGAILLAHQQGYTGWAVHEMASSYPTSGEIYQARDKGFISCFIRKKSSGVETEYRLMRPNSVYEKLTNKAWHITPAGREVLARLVAGLPEVDSLRTHCSYCGEKYSDEETSCCSCGSPR